MKKKNLIIIGIISLILVITGLVTSYIDNARVRNSIEPKYTIKITTDGGNKVTYWGLGYKVIRYPSVSPNEPYKNNLGVKMGSWFMNYKLSEYENIDVELLTENKTVQVSKTRDIEFIISLLRDSKYKNGLCNGIRTHKIKIDDEEYHLIEGCSEIQKGKKQATISKEDLDKFLKIIDDYNEKQVNDEINNRVTTIDIQTTGLSSTTPMKKYTLNQEEIYIVFNIIDNLTFIKETCDGIPTYFIRYNSEEKENFISYGIEVLDNKYHITSNEKGEAILSGEQTKELNEIIKKLDN